MQSDHVPESFIIQKLDEYQVEQRNCLQRVDQLKKELENTMNRAHQAAGGILACNQFLEFIHNQKAAAKAAQEDANDGDKPTG